MKNNMQTRSIHWAWALGLLVAAYLWSDVLFAITLGVLVSVAVIRWKTQEEDQNTPSKAEEVHGALPDATITSETNVRIPLGDAFATIELLPIEGMESESLVSIRFPLNSPIPFCFILRRNRALTHRERLVRNTPLKESQFEYELKGLPLEPWQLENQYEGRANYPKLLTQLLDAGLGEDVQRLHGDHQFLLQMLTYDGTSLELIGLPASTLDDSAQLHHIQDRCEEIGETIAGFIAAEGLVEAVRARS